MAYSASDPFSKLPAELRLHVIMSANCMRTISRLIRASPFMLQLYLAHKRYIQRNVMDYDDAMMQDAMAVILIPRLCQTSKEVPDEKTIIRARKVLQDWSLGQLPHPTIFDHVTIQLRELHNRILVFAEDYFSKATASFPPRDYCCLPQVQPLSANEYLMFKGVEVAPRFNFADLSASEKKRIIQAFLRHELMCRASILFPDPFSPEATRLTSTEKMPVRLTSHCEIEGINCVGSYYCSLYGAIFAQCSDSQLPSSPGATSSDGTSLGTDLVFPDTFLFDGNTYAHEVGLLVDSWWEGNYTPGSYPDFTHWFSLLGLDRLTDFLGYDMAKEDGREALKLHIQDIWYDCHDHDLGSWAIPQCTIFKRPFRDMIGHDSPMYGKLKEPVGPTLKFLIARQRAWALLDDTRLYPQETYERPNLPSRSFLKEKCIEIFNDVQHWFWLDVPSLAQCWRRIELSYEERKRAGFCDAPFAGASRWNPASN
ncbi:hypothetical protein FLONG3_2443 [Fusarium longipes]|uniref:Uncharacterized protein n=1 Tax=Fusarium longipes TaxID=694270 RepID=A0A395T3W4_9HYPO|nr:hypothetical protein FLONG3_2443 [Fusarium longipes]